MLADLELLKRQLKDEGFVHTYLWKDVPGAFYSDHTHDTLTAHIILDGEMTVIQGHDTKTYTAGERCDVAGGAVHAARMGSNGCRYLVGEK